MILPYSPKLKSYSRELRKNMTDAEKKIWGKLRRKQLKKCQFYRQRVIGEYIVDFFVPPPNWSSKSMAANTIRKMVWAEIRSVMITLKISVSRY